jgi:hypothetical protein
MAGCRLFQIGSLALGALVAAPLPAQSGAQPQVKARLDVDKPVTVPFEYFNGHIFVLLNINGSAGMPFLFDTGTSADILDLQTSQRLGLKPEKVTRQKNLGLGSDKVAMAAAKDVDVTMGGLYVANTLALLDLSGMQQVNGHRIDGILGYPLLERFVVALDFAKRAISLEPAKEFKYRGPGEVLPLARKKYPATVKVVLETLDSRQHDATVEVDTGADATLLIYSKYAERAHLPQDPAKPQNDQVYGIGGFVRIHRATLRYLGLGDTAFTPLTALFLQTTPETRATRKLGGAIGTGILAKYQRVIFDVPHLRIIFEHASTR